MVSFTFSFFFPWLAALLLIQSGAGMVKKRPQGWRLTSVFAIIAGIIVVVPVRGLPLGRWLIGVNANFSFPLAAAAFNKAWENATGRQLLDHHAWAASWIFGLTAAAVLYPMALGLGDFDPYVLGWEFSWLFAGLAMATIGLLLIKNRFAVVLIICILGYDLNLLESHNIWDYLVDPFFVFLSLGAVARWLTVRMRTALRGSTGMDGGA